MCLLLGHVLVNVVLIHCSFIIFDSDFIRLLLSAHHGQLSLMFFLRF